jgi:putative DNA primase/helicase
MVTRLKSISGEDDVAVQRKNIDDWLGRLYAKIVLAANQTPRLKDLSGAIASRVIVIKFTKSFLGEEDYDLDEMLKAERPGIFNLALRALDQMRGRDGTKLRGPIQPDSGREAKAELEWLTSDILAFVDECCELGPTFEVPLDRIFWNIDSGVFSKISAVRGRSRTSPQPFAGSFHRLLYRGRESLSSRRIIRVGRGHVC